MYDSSELRAGVDELTSADQRTTDEAKIAGCRSGNQFVPLTSAAKRARASAARQRVRTDI